VSLGASLYEEKAASMDWGGLGVGFHGRAEYSCVAAITWSNATYTPQVRKQGRQTLDSVTVDLTIPVPCGGPTIEGHGRWKDQGLASGAAQTGAREVPR
jgi:hypothetical protein